MSPTVMMLAAFSSGQAPQPAAVPAIPQAMPAAPVTAVQATAPAPLPAAMPAPNGTVLPSAPVLGPTAAPITPGLAPSQVSPLGAQRIAPELERAPTAEQADEPAEEAENFFIMRRLEGTSLGTLLADRRVSISGWTQMSYTFSSTDVTNQPVTWNDRANKFLLNQTWLRLDKAVDTESKEASFGYRVDGVFGTDYRFTLMRGLFTNQLLRGAAPGGAPPGNQSTEQNMYGADLIQFYVNAYLPNVFEGTDVRVGRLFTPFGYESLEGVSTPFVSRSYAFNWAPPFTHMGIMVSPKFNDKWSGKYMIANGNDVWFNDSQEVRFVGATTYTPGENDAITFGMSLGRGKMNTGQPFNPATIGLQTEPAGRPNINVFDLVWTHKINDKLNYAFESIYGYQWGVPANVPGGIIALNKAVGQTGTMNWYSFVQYLTYAHTDTLSSVARLEFFDDVQGGRTGFEGLYTGVTYGLNWVPVPGIIVRPQVRYDYCNQSTPFEGKNDIWTGGFEWIFRY